MMHDPSILALYIKGLRTHLVTNTLEGISATLYQEKGKKWRSVDHIISTLSEQKKR